MEDLKNQKLLHLDAIEITVLDEADHMADLGFLPVVTKILSATPAGGQRLLFSATLDNGVNKLVATSIYLKLQDEIVSLFKQNWRDISSGKIVAFAQDHDKSSYHAKKELAKLDKVDFDELSARGLFNLLRARSFGEKGFAYFEAEGLKYFLNLKITPESPKSG